MKWISRADMGWPASAAPTQLENPVGIKIHYEGTYVPVVDHSKCVGRWTDIRNSHLANPTEGYSDVAYNLAVCRHGYVLEGRGSGRRTGANGNQSLNATHYAVLVMIGSEGDTEPTAQAVSATKEAIHYLRTHNKPAGREIKGHRDGFATSCPGGPLYSLVQSGSLEPGSITPTPDPVEEDVLTQETINLWNGMIWGLKHTTEATELLAQEQLEVLKKIAAKLGVEDA